METHRETRNTMSALQRCRADKRSGLQKTVRVSCLYLFHKESRSMANLHTRSLKCVRSVALPHLRLHDRLVLRARNMFGGVAFINSIEGLFLTNQ